MSYNPSNPAWIKKIKAMIGKGQAELVDDWLQRHRGVGTVCHTKEATVYLPVKEKEAREAMEKLKRAMTDVFEGVTVWEGDGVFCEAFDVMRHYSGVRRWQFRREAIGVCGAHVMSAY